MNTGADRTIRVLVTGSRGKSSVVRLLHAGLDAAGITTRARITGVEPRQLGPSCSRTILRSAGAHVEEMHWWLRQLPPDTQAVVLENSAITPELQPLAARWLRPGISVLCNILPDHQEAWGPSREGAAEALVAGLPAGGQVVLPADLQHDPMLRRLLERRRSEVIPASPAADVAAPHRAANLGLAQTVLTSLGAASDAAMRAMRSLAPGRYGFRVVGHGGAELAMAFSANDLESTRSLFHSLHWPEEQTRLVYNHRADRPGRLASFSNWLRGGRWRDVLVIGDRPLTGPGSKHFTRLNDAGQLLGLFRPGDRVFGCGNIAGLPMALY